MHSGETWPSVNQAAKALGVAAPSMNEAIKNHWKCAGHDLVFDTPDTYCVCCQAKIETKARGTLSLFPRKDLKAEVAEMVG
jgi:hypothetical protein